MIKIISRFFLWLNSLVQFYFFLILSLIIIFSFPISLFGYMRRGLISGSWLADSNDDSLFTSSLFPLLMNFRNLRKIKKKCQNLKLMNGLINFIGIEPGLGRRARFSMSESDRPIERSRKMGSMTEFSLPSIQLNLEQTDYPDSCASKIKYYRECLSKRCIQKFWLW